MPGCVRDGCYMLHGLLSFVSRLRPLFKGLATPYRIEEVSRHGYMTHSVSM